MGFATRVLDPLSNVVHNPVSGGSETRKWLSGMKPQAQQPWQAPAPNPNYAAFVQQGQQQGTGSGSGTGKTGNTSLLGG